MSNISGFEEFAEEMEQAADNFKNAAEEADEGLEDLLDLEAMNVRVDAQRNAPDGTKHGKRLGTEKKLSQSFEVEQIDDRAFDVRNDAGHAVPQEFGTKPHTISPNEETAMIFRDSRTGEWVQTKKPVQHPGHEALWFLRRAVQAQDDSLERQMRQLGNDIMSEAASD